MPNDAILRLLVRRHPPIASLRSQVQVNVSVRVILRYRTLVANDAKVGEATILQCLRKLGRQRQQELFRICLEKRFGRFLRLEFFELLLEFLELAEFALVLGLQCLISDTHEFVSSVPRVDRFTGMTDQKLDVSLLMT